MHLHRNRFFLCFLFACVFISRSVPGDCADVHAYVSCCPLSPSPAFIPSVPSETLSHSELAVPLVSYHESVQGYHVNTMSRTQGSLTRRGATAA
ncbi:hypothetical protein C8R47DRAFT_1108950 [Mycena vitilis]|nr:hypothetical protein C8R47DRAFT_1108950 [Mycena vitilis]